MNMRSTLRLFRAVPVSNRIGKREASEDILAETIKRGFVFSPKVIHNYNEAQLLSLIRIIERELGLNAKQMNNSFHKSWHKGELL